MATEANCISNYIFHSEAIWPKFSCAKSSIDLLGSIFWNKTYQSSNRYSPWYQKFESPRSNLSYARSARRNSFDKYLLNRRDPSTCVTKSEKRGWFFRIDSLHFSLLHGEEKKSVPRENKGSARLVGLVFKRIVGIESRGFGALDADSRSKASKAWSLKKRQVEERRSHEGPRGDWRREISRKTAGGCCPAPEKRTSGPDVRKDETPKTLPCCKGNYLRPSTSSLRHPLWLTKSSYWL